MTDSHFFGRPILNSPYGYPSVHWELDPTGQPTQKVVDARRSADFITPIPKPKKQKGVAKQTALLFDEGLSTQDQQYHSAIINGVRADVDKWRAIKNLSLWIAHSALKCRLGSVSAPFGKFRPIEEMWASLFAVFNHCDWQDCGEAATQRQSMNLLMGQK